MLFCVFLLDPLVVLFPSFLSYYSKLSLSSLGSVTPNPISQSYQATPNKKSEEVQYMSNKCPECLAQFNNKDEVAEHFQEIEPANTTVSLVCVYVGKIFHFICFLMVCKFNSKLNSFLWSLHFSFVVLQPCTECSPPMLLPNSCSAAAHQRIHQCCPPHVCPECGGTAKQQLFQTHLDESCLHFARRIGYRCDIPPTQLFY